MRKLLASRPSPAMAVAFVALLAALSGTAIALPGTNSVDSGDIKNNVVRSKDVRNNNLRSGDVRNSTLTGTDVRNDSLTGADINESTLGQVPSASTAGSANTANTANTANSANTAGNAANADRVGGSSGGTIRTFNFRSTADPAGPTEVLNLNGLTLTATCDSTNGLQVVAHYSGSDAFLQSSSTDQFEFDDETDTGGDTYSDNDANFALFVDFGTTGTNDIDLVTDTFGVTSLGHTFVSDDGVSITVEWQAEAIAYLLSGQTFPCVFQGSATSN
jgi:hypothetical protein